MGVDGLANGKCWKEKGEVSWKISKVNFSNSQVPWVIYHPPCTLASTTSISLSSVTFHWYCLLVSLKVSLLLLSLHSDCYCWAMNSRRSGTFVTACRHLHCSTSAFGGAMRRADSLEDCSLSLCTVEFDCDRQMLHIASASPNQLLSYHYINEKEEKFEIINKHSELSRCCKVITLCWFSSLIQWWWEWRSWAWTYFHT